jgi:hypothetical protein
MWSVAAEVARLFDVRTIVLVRAPAEAGDHGLVLCAHRRRSTASN